MFVGQVSQYCIDIEGLKLLEEVAKSILASLGLGWWRLPTERLISETFTHLFLNALAHQADKVEDGRQFGDCYETASVLRNPWLGFSGLPRTLVQLLHGNK
jgi:hypothetical protein